MVLIKMLKPEIGRRVLICIYNVVQFVYIVQVVACKAMEEQIIIRKGRLFNVDIIC